MAGITGFTGDVDGSAATVILSTLADNAVTNAKLADMATQTFKGRSSGTGVPEDLTATQATALINSMVGDSGSGGTKGLVPAPASGAAASGKLLRADGTWVGNGGTITAPVAYTPVCTGLGTPTITYCVSWREGPYLVILGRITTGTTTAVEAQMTLGFNGTSANVSSFTSYSTLNIVGTMHGGTTSGTYFGRVTVLAEANKTYLTFSANISGGNGFVKQVGSTCFFNAAAYTLQARVLIQGWGA